MIRVQFVRNLRGLWYKLQMSASNKQIERNKIHLVLFLHSFTFVFSLCQFDEEIGRYSR
jgi:hypothetical protein